MGWLRATCWIHTLIQSLLSTGTTHTSTSPYEIFQFQNELESQDIAVRETDFQATEWVTSWSLCPSLRTVIEPEKAKEKTLMSSEYLHTVQTNRLLIPPGLDLVFLCSFFPAAARLSQWLGLTRLWKLALRTKREHSAYLFKKHHGNNAVSLSLWRRRRSNSPPVPPLPPPSFLSSLEYWSGINSLVYLPSPVLLPIRSY